jgi:DnaJ-class molecular chaperone
MTKNYYVILGVAHDATLEQIKAAFRRRALELHPDRSGLGSEPFQEIQEAYGVLGDPERRRRYDRRLRPATSRRPAPRPDAEPMTAPRPEAEPFRSGAPARSLRDISLADSFEVYRPSFEELFDRFWSNFELVDRPKAERLESLTVEVVLTPEEARVGGQVRVPARAACPACGGRGAMGPYECWQCQGHGALTTEYPVEVAYPPGVRDGHALRLSLTQFGIENFYLTVLLRVSHQWD